MMSAVVLLGTALNIFPAKVCDSLVRITVYASSPVAPSTALAIVKSSDTFPSLALIVKVLNSTSVGFTVIVAPDLVTPIGGLEIKSPPSVEYLQELIVVFTLLPVTVKLEDGVNRPVLSCFII